MSVVKYSIGPNTSDHKTGTPTCTISAGVMTFSTAQTNAMLVAGDRVTYDTSKICYLFSKVGGSLTQWNVVTATGAAPSNEASPVTVDSIAHEYTSLGAAEAGAADANHLNTQDLVTATTELRLVCASTADTSATVTFDSGWITSAAYRIYVYSPTNTRTECNARHFPYPMKWDASMYTLTSSNLEAITNNVAFITFHHLQIHVSNVTSYGCEGIYCSTGSTGPGWEIHHCIIRGTPTATQDNHYATDSRSTTGTGTMKIWNNLVYDFRRSDSIFHYDLAFNQSGTAATVTIYCFNNTVHNCHMFSSSRSTGTPADANFHLKNNLSQDIVGGAADWEFDYQYYNPASNYQCATGAYSPLGGGGGNDQLSASTSFMDEANDDFHLAYGDTTARGNGTDLSSDGNCPVVDDGDSIPRPSVSAFDIGALQFNILKPRLRMEGE